MITLRTLITDDEPLAIEVLQSHLKGHANIELVGTCKDAIEAYSFIIKNPIDLLLLDINMPEINGIEFLRSLKEPPMVIYTTAYPNYALESYELNAVDYLLKPISLERLNKAIEKAYHLKQNTLQAPNTAPQKVLFVRSDSKWLRIDVNNIWLVEGLGDYIKVCVNDERIIIHSTMKNFEDQLKPYPQFARVHKSYIVNINFISQSDSNSLIINNQTISVGAVYKENLQKLIQANRLA
ncbi:MAG: response regulator transcription factor [bacterium]|nr:response regulator transcription factor [bacterium]